MPTIIDGTTGVDQIQDGTVTEAKIADGAVTAAKLAAGVISTTSVLAATADASVGAVGTYFFGNTQFGVVQGSTTAGSNLRKVNSSGTFSSAGLSGTWRHMGGEERGQFTVYLRIS
jgi:hypothetical protein